MPRSLEITVGARSSPLSQKQVEEVYEELIHYHPEIMFKKVFAETRGDKDKQTSLRLLEKTDFFTREIDEMVLSGTCRVAIHSAKDLPDPLTKGLKIAAITKGVDPSDALVFREKEVFPKAGIVATSSERREEMVRALFPEVSFVDIRGTIQERLEKLALREVDGVVIAEAAIIRLGLANLKRILLPGATAPMQGRLAVVICENDHPMQELFGCLHCPVAG